VTEIVDGIYWIFFYGIQQRGMNDRSSIDKINPPIIALTATAIHHCLSAWKPGEFRQPDPDFHSSSPEVQARRIDNIHTTIR